jgi:hypothetical protein
MEGTSVPMEQQPAAESSGVVSLEH